MRSSTRNKLAPWLVILLVLGLAWPVLADEDVTEEDDQSVLEEQLEDISVEDDWSDIEWEDEESGFTAYRNTVSNRFKIGVNSLATFPADPVMSTVEPRDEFDELPGAKVTKYPVGFLQGVMLMAYRAGMGTLDVVLAPVTPFRMLSPEPRYRLFSDMTHDLY